MRTIEEIAENIAEGLEPWLAHEDDCVCTGDTVIHVPMCGNCSCGLRDALMAEAVEAATDDEVVAYVKANGEDPDVLAAHVRNTLRAAWFKHREHGA